MNPTDIWWTLPLFMLTIGVVFGLAPGLILWAIVQLYPKGHPHRKDILVQFDAVKMGRIKKYEWVFMQLERALRLGLPLRLRARAERRRIAKELRRISRHLKRLDTGQTHGDLHYENVLIKLSP